MIVKYFAVRHVPTGKFLPQLRKKRGYTHTEPMALDEAVPRLHKTLNSAKQALRYWLKGEWHESYSRQFFGDAEYEGNFPVAKSERVAADMEIAVLFVVRQEFEGTENHAHSDTGDNRLGRGCSRTVTETQPV